MASSQSANGPASRTWDGLVLGTGHNALVLQAYLARAGFKVLSVDRGRRARRRAGDRREPPAAGLSGTTRTRSSTGP